MRTALLIRLVLLTLIGFAAALAVPAGQARATQQVASAVASCSGSSCTGKSPQVQGCAPDGRTVSSFTADMGSNLNQDVYVELRHSNTCRAKWIRVTAPDSNWGCGGAEDVRVRLRNFSADSVLTTQIANFGACEIRTQRWTMMAGRSSGSYRTEFCFRLISPVGGSTPYTCKFNLW